MEDIEKILEDSKQLIENCKNLQAELEAIEKGKEFLLNEYKTNKHWFRDEPGRVTIEDVIKRAFEFGWSSKSNFDYMQKKIDYEALYKKLKKDIEDQHDYWKTKELESHSVERQTRVSEYGRLEALIIGLEKTAREEAIDKSYEQTIDKQ